MRNFIEFNKGKKEKKLFIFYGLLNVFFTNLILQIGLFFFPILLATFLSQIFNLNFGYYTYGKKVFMVNKLKKRHFVNYILLNFILWNMNWLLISFLNLYYVSRNISADRMNAIGLGENSPIDTNVNPDGRSKNRRVEIVFEK